MPGGATANTSGHPQTEHTPQRILNDGFDRDFDVPVAEQLGYDGKNLVRQRANAIAIIFDKSGGYVGYAPVGSLTSASAWQIQKLDTSNGVAITYANGSSNYDQIWDNRASLSFS